MQTFNFSLSDSAHTTLSQEGSGRAGYLKWRLYFCFLHSSPQTTLVIHLLLFKSATYNNFTIIVVDYSMPSNAAVSLDSHGTPSPALTTQQGRPEQLCHQVSNTILHKEEWSARATTVYAAAVGGSHICNFSCTVKTNMAVTTDFGDECTAVRFLFSIGKRSPLRRNTTRGSYIMNFVQCFRLLRESEFSQIYTKMLSTPYSNQYFQFTFNNKATQKLSLNRLLLKL